MALNKESNGFTFGFAIVLVVVLGVILASLAEGLKPLKEKNVRVKKQIDILSAMMDVEKESFFHRLKYIGSFFFFLILYMVYKNSWKV